MKISYSVDKEDIIAAHRYHWDHSPSAQRSRRLNLWGGTAAMVGLGVFETFRQHDAGRLVVGAVLGAAYFAITYYYYARHWENGLRRSFSQGPLQGLAGRHELELTETELIDRTSAGSQSIVLKTLERVAEDATHYFIYVNSVSAHVVPKSGVEGDLPGFIAAVKSAVGGAPAR